MKYYTYSTIKSIKSIKSIKAILEVTNPLLHMFNQCLMDICVFESNS